MIFTKTSSISGLKTSLLFDIVLLKITVFLFSETKVKVAEDLVVSVLKLDNVFGLVSVELIVESLFVLVNIELDVVILVGLFGPTITDMNSF